jgi:Mg/Co/Ni transporter MgtE
MMERVGLDPALGPGIILTAGADVSGLIALRAFVLLFQAYLV